MSSDQLLSSAQVCYAADATYRQLDHALRAGLVPHLWTTSAGRIVEEGGSGKRRAFTVPQALAFAAVAAVRRSLAGGAGANPDLERALVDYVLDDDLRTSAPAGTWWHHDDGVAVSVDLHVIGAKVEAALRAKVHLETSTGEVVVEEAPRG